MAPEERIESRLRLSTRDLKYFLLLVGALGLVFWDVFLLQKAFLSGDHLIQHYPWAKFLQDSIRRFRLPWWTDQIQCGFPLLAEGQIGAFYPPNLFFLFFLPLRWAYNYEVLFHFTIGGFFSYLYLRHLGLSAKASFFSALIFLFGSTEGGFFYNITSQRVSVWFPLTLLLVERLIKKTTFRRIVLLGLVFAFQIFGGYLQIAIYSISFTTLYFILRLTPIFGSSRTPEKFRLLYRYALALLIGLAVSAVQWVPTLELSAFSSRAKALEPLAYMGSPMPFFLMTSLFPDWTGFWNGGIYVGILGLFFVLWSLFSKKGDGERLWIMIFVIALSLAFGKYSPLYVFFVKVFRLYFFRVPSKFLFFAAFSLIVLSGYGFDKFLGQKSKKEGFKKTSMALTGFFLVLVISITAGHLIAYLFRQPLLHLLERYVATRIYGQPYHPHSLETYKQKLVSYYGLFLRLTYFGASQTKWPSLLFLAEMGIFTVLFRVKRIDFLLFILLFVDLFYYAHLNTRRDLNPFVIVNNPSKLVEHIREERGIFRTYEFNTEPLRADRFPFVPNQNMLLGVEDIGIYSPFAFSGYKNFLGDLGGVDDSLYQNEASVEALKSRREVLDRLNVKYVLSNVTLSIKDFKPIAEERGIRLYENTRYWPRVFYTEKINRFPHFDAIRKVEILKREEGRMVLDAHNFDQGYLIVSGQNYPGWRILRNSQIIKPVTLEHGLKAIPLTQKTNEIELSYEPKHRRSLSWISLGAMLLVLGGVLRKNDT